MLNQARSWRKLFGCIASGGFALDRATFGYLHAYVARNEALKWGVLRTGPVQIGGTKHRAPPADTLVTRMDAALRTIGAMDNVHHRAIAAFLWTARNQPFWDGNKRTGRLMMNGVLLDHDYDVLTVAASKQLEFNEKMIRFYDSADAGPMLEFMTTCSLDPNVRCEAAKRETGT